MLDKRLWRIEFGIKLKRVMNVLGYTQKDLSIKTGIPPSYLSRYMNGGSIPYATTVMIMCQQMGLAYETLFLPEYPDIMFFDEYDSLELSELEWTDDFSIRLNNWILPPDKARVTANDTYKEIAKAKDKQLWISERCGISQGYLSQFLKGKRIPNAYTVYRLAHAFEYIDDLNEFLDICKVYKS